MRNKNKLKEDHQYISEDFPKDVLEARKKLILNMMKAGGEGKNAIIKYDKLIIKDFPKSDNNNFKKRPLTASLIGDVEGENGNDNMMQYTEKKNKLDNTYKPKHKLNQFMIPKGIGSRRDSNSDSNPEATV